MWRVLAPVAFFVPMLWAPGLLGLLGMLGLPLGLASLVLYGAVIAMMGLAVWSARGTYFVREHVRDMLPWALTVWVIVLVLR